tara:strand:+ start:142 stop:525 length:384 start_codon:yes stop_codon:yes gene_type:complete
LVLNLKKFILYIITLNTFLFANEFKNVKVLSFETKKEMIKYMKKTVSKSLGVKCKFCHNMKDYSDDSIPNKIIAREMMRMVKSMNTHLETSIQIKAKSEGEEKIIKNKFDCWTCHQSSIGFEFKNPD